MVIFTDVLDRKYQESLAEEPSKASNEGEGEEGAGSSGAAKGEEKVRIHP